MNSVVIKRQLGTYTVEHNGTTVCTTRLEAVAALVAERLATSLEYGGDCMQDLELNMLRAVKNRGRNTQGDFEPDYTRDGVRAVL